MWEKLKEFAIGMAVIVAGAVAFVWIGSNGWLPDTAKEHQDRLSCEQTQMLGGNLANVRMSAPDAEAFCEKLIEMQKAYEFDKGKKNNNQ